MHVDLSQSRSPTERWRNSSDDPGSRGARSVRRSTNRRTALGRATALSMRSPVGQGSQFTTLTKLTRREFSVCPRTFLPCSTGLRGKVPAMSSEALLSPHKDVLDTLEFVADFLMNTALRHDAEGRSDAAMLLIRAGLDAAIRLEYTRTTGKLGQTLPAAICAQKLRSGMHFSQQSFSMVTKLWKHGGPQHLKRKELAAIARILHPSTGAMNTTGLPRTTAEARAIYRGYMPPTKKTRSAVQEGRPKPR